MQKQYDVVRFSQAGRRRIVRRGVSLAEAQRLCSDPETSSKTARKPRGCNSDTAMIDRWHDRQKHWFWGYEEATR